MIPKGYRQRAKNHVHVGGKFLLDIQVILMDTDQVCTMANKLICLLTHIVLGSSDFPSISENQKYILCKRQQSNCFWKLVRLKTEYECLETHFTFQAGTMLILLMQVSS